MEKYLDIALYPTSRCDTGCRHCIDDCNMNNPVDFSPEMAQVIVDEARKEDRHLAMYYTGFGEPLMAPHLLEISEIFNDYEKLYRIGMVTSGFKNGDTERETRLKRLFKLMDDRWYFTQSFNLFHSSFLERLKNLMEMIAGFDYDSKAYKMDVRMCVSYDNIQETWETFGAVLDAVAMEHGFLHNTAMIKLDKSSVEAVQYFMNERSRIACGATIFEARLQPQWHFLIMPETKSHIAMLVQPILLSGAGRAMQTKHINSGRFNCPVLTRFFQEGDYAPLSVFPDGRVCAECCRHIVFGRIGEDPVVIMQDRYKTMIENLFSAIVEDCRMFKKWTDDICRVCRAIAAVKKW